MSDHERHDVYIVVTSDGVLFRCHVEPIDGMHAIAVPHWIFMRGDGLRFIGPPATPVATADEMRAIVESWWQDRKAGPYANVTAETLRAKLMAEEN